MSIVFLFAPILLWKHTIGLRKALATKTNGVVLGFGNGQNILILFWGGE
jgi:hypothetical protein